jgi:purine-binding chemotaxis protein CheW
MTELVAFELDKIVIALQASTVIRVVHAVEIATLPGAPDIVIGIIEVGGLVIPVVNLRRRLGLPEQPLQLSDRFVIALSGQRTLAIVADVVAGVFDYNDTDITDPSSLISGTRHITGIAHRNSDIIFIHDLNRFLFSDEAEILDNAMTAIGGQDTVHAF